ncbi:MAG: transcriptional regulator [Alphaproteobacteria bacterium]|nr:MAG: transcriptional regulator [Alphaproteobacteria bacterium]
MLSDKMKKLWDGFSDADKAAIDVRYAHLHAEYMTLQEMRKSQNVTQDSMAKLLGIKQENVSRMERRDDMRLSTMRDYIEALGGKIQINAVFPNDEVISIVNGSEKSRV